MNKRSTIASWEHAERRRRIYRVLNFVRQFCVVLALFLLVIMFCNYAGTPFVDHQAVVLVFEVIAGLIVLAALLHLGLRRYRR